MSQNEREELNLEEDKMSQNKGEEFSKEFVQMAVEYTDRLLKNNGEILAHNTYSTGAESSMNKATSSEAMKADDLEGTKKVTHLKKEDGGQCTTAQAVCSTAPADKESEKDALMVASAYQRIDQNKPSHTLSNPCVIPEAVSCGIVANVERKQEFLQKKDQINSNMGGHGQSTSSLNQGEEMHTSSSEKGDVMSAKENITNNNNDNLTVSLDDESLLANVEKLSVPMEVDDGAPSEPVSKSCNMNEQNEDQVTDSEKSSDSEGPVSQFVKGPHFYAASKEVQTGKRREILISNTVLNDYQATDNPPRKGQNSSDEFSIETKPSQYDANENQTNEEQSRLNISITGQTTEIHKSSLDGKPTFDRQSEDRLNEKSSDGQSRYFEEDSQTQQMHNTPVGTTSTSLTRQSEMKSEKVKTLGFKTLKVQLLNLSKVDNLMPGRMLSIKKLKRLYGKELFKKGGKCGNVYKNKKGANQPSKASRAGILKRKTTTDCASLDSESNKSSDSDDDHLLHKKYRCTECRKGFSSPQALQQHQRTFTHNRTFMCAYCDKLFSKSVHRNRHVRKHTGEKPYECEHCNKTFARMEHLTAHTYTHTGERPHVCDICGKGFTRIDHLKRHRMNVHQVQVKVNTSNIYRKPTWLLKKQRQRAEKSTGITQNAAVENRNGTNDNQSCNAEPERPFVCDDCGKAFKRVSHLNRHKINVHKLMKINDDDLKKSKISPLSQETQTFEDNKKTTQISDKVENQFVTNQVENGQSPPKSEG